MGDYLKGEVMIKIKGESVDGVSLALSLGYHVYWREFNGLHFIHPQKNRTIWRCFIQSFDTIGWQTADCIADFYENHEPFETLREALMRELAE